MAIRLVLADDHPVVREGFKALLERQGFQVVGEASNGQEAVELARKLRPEVAVLDLAMPILNGLDAGQRVKAVLPAVKLVIRP